VTAYLKALRLERWPRSLAIFLGSAAYVFLHRDAPSRFGLHGLAWRSTVAYLLTWGISTANYIVNEIVDLPYDVHHPTKRFRPLVRGEIRETPFALLGIGLTLACLSASLVVFDRAFFFSLASLLLAGFVYNVRPIRTKDIPFLDAISESANNPIRFLIGWFAFAGTGEHPPVSMLLSWWSFGNFLMVAKRLSEFRFLKEKAGDYRTSHRKYNRESLLLGMILSASISLAAFFYVGYRFKLQTFILIAPFLVVFFFLIFRKTLREAEVMEEPEKLLVRPKYALYALFLLALFALTYFWDTVGR
jgi:decaprenyl-phosphate phosphoribosyltransferase